MSQENVDALRAFLETITDIPAFVDAAKRGDVDLSALDPDVAYEDENLPDHIGETYRGYEGVIRAAERWAEASEVLTIELQRIIGSGDRLISIHGIHSRPATAALSSTSPSLTSGRSGMAGSFTSGPIKIRATPSKPPGCGSRSLWLLLFAKSRSAGWRRDPPFASDGYGVATGWQ